MKSKENNPHYAQANSFFGEIKDQIEQFKQKFEEREDSNDQKQKRFELEKVINDFEYKSNQKDLKLKRELDEKLRDKKD